MKGRMRIIAAGLVLILLAGLLAGCGDELAETPSAPGETVSAEDITADPVPTVSQHDAPPDPVPAVSRYDALSDPDVIWASGRYRPGMFVWETGRAVLGWQLETMVNAVYGDIVLTDLSGDTLVAVDVYGPSIFSLGSPISYPEIEADEIEIPEELDIDGKLTELVAAYAAASGDYLRKVYAAHYLSVYLSRGPYGEFASQEERNEAYRVWKPLEEEVRTQLMMIYAEELRQMMMDHGYTPVYSDLSQEHMLDYLSSGFCGSFVMTLEQVNDIRENIGENDTCVITLAQKADAPAAH